MSKFSEKLETFTVRAPSPDYRVLATCVGSKRLTVSLPDPEAYDDYRDAGELADQIAVAMQSAYDGAQQGRRLIVEKYSRLRSVDRAYWDADVRRDLDARDAAVSEAISPDGSVTIETVGLRQWTVWITADAFASLPAAQLLAQVNYAIRAVQRVHAANLRELRTTR